VRPPIVWIAVAFGAGLWVGLSFFGAWGLGGWVGLPVLAGGLLVERRAPLGAATGVMLVAGLLWGGAADRERAADCVGKWGRAADGAGTRAAIVRLDDPAPAGGGVVDAEAVAGACRGALRLRWPDGLHAPGGTTWVVAGRWAEEGPKDRGVLVVRRARLLDSTRRGRGGLRDRVVGRADTLFGARAPMVDALVIARRAGLDPDVRERYAQAGLAHLLAISGLHVGFIAAWLGVVLGLTGLGPRPRLAAAAVLLLGYVWLLGFPAPATRAALMLALAGVTRLRQRVVAPAGSITLAALLVMLVDPWSVRSVGAWLSVTAVASVIWARRAAERSAWPVRLVAPAVAATILTAPITAFAFGTVAPIGVLANLVAIPLAGVAVPGLVLALALSWLWPWLASLVAAGSGLGLALLDLIAQGAAAVPGGHVVMIAGWGAAAVWLGVAAAAWWLWTTPRRPWLVAARIAFLTTVLVATSLRGVVSLDECRCLSVHFLDVGQGDAAVLRTPAGRWIVIDGGPRTPESDAGRRVVIPFLRRHGARRLALAVATHGDADHLGGLPAVVDAFHPALVLEPGEPLGRPLYLEFLAAVEAAGSRWHPARRGDRIELDSVTLEVLSPDSLWLALPLDVNEHGVVLRVSYGGVRLLFQADAGLPVEGRLAGRVGRVELLKVGHHGSASATSDAWLAELRPREAVISVGAHNHYGHPAPAVLARLRRWGSEIYRTDQAGTITFTTDGHAAHIDVHHHD